VALGLVLTGQSAQATPTPTTAATDLRQGGLFLQTNEREGNEIVAYSRGADGRLTPAGRYATGGGGSGSFEDSSNGLVLGDSAGESSPNNLTDNHKFLFSTNAGTNEISVFAVGAKDLKLVGKFPSGGQKPVSLTVSHGFLYVLNSGETTNQLFDFQGNAVENCASGLKPSLTGFWVDSNGRLKAIPGSTRQLSGAADSGCAQVSFDPSGHTLVATERLAKQRGYTGEKEGVIDSFPVNADGTLGTRSQITPTGISPFGFTFTRNGTLLTTEQFFGYYGPGRAAVASYGVGSGGALKPTSGSVHTGRTDTCWIVATGDGKYAYTASAWGDGPISLLKLGGKGFTGDFDPVASSPNDDPKTSHLTNGSTDLVLSSDSKYLYSLNSFEGFISVFRVRADGTLGFVQRVQALHLLTFGYGGEATPFGLAAA
jgi:6-phosphogluconolactonase (cycloisomerase 2 family)